MNLVAMVTMGLISALPTGPSLYHVYRNAAIHKSLSLKDLTYYLAADFVHIVVVLLLVNFIKPVQNYLAIGGGLFLILLAVQLLIKKTNSATEDAKTMSSEKLFFVVLFNPLIPLFYLGLFGGIPTDSQYLLILTFFVSFIFGAIFFSKVFSGIGYKLTSLFFWADKVVGLSFLIYGLNLLIINRGSL